MSPLRDIYQFATALLGVVDTSPTGFQNLRFWGLTSQVQVLKAEVPDVGTNSSFLREKSLLIVYIYARGGVYGKMSQPL